MSEIVSVENSVKNVLRTRVGGKPVACPPGVTADFLSEREISIKGSLGQVSLLVPDDLECLIEGSSISVSPKRSFVGVKSIWGTFRQNLSNAVFGVSVGFAKDLKIKGVGYRVSKVNSSDIVLKLGFSKDVSYKFDSDVKITSDSPTGIRVFGISKQKVGQVAAEIKSLRPVEPFKGKGIKYSGESERRKERKR
jgi:large subunit ribosomal protein L6